MTTTTVGRGRGRGRGGVLSKVFQEQKPGPISPTQPTTPSTTTTTTTNSQNAVSKDALQAIVKKMDSMTVSEVLKNIPSEIQKIKSAGNIEELINLLCEKSINEPDFAVVAAKLCNVLWSDEELKTWVKNPLLSSLQQNYRKRDELRKKRNDKYYGLCVFLGELYKYLRIKGQPLGPLTTPVCQMLKELIESSKPSTEDVLYFYQVLESVGETIEKMDQFNPYLPYFPHKGKLDDIINTARQVVISSQDISPTVRCRLVQAIEFHASNWKMTDELKILYEDLQQDLMSEGY